MRILLRLKGGLGNQMFQYAAGRALSLDRGARLEFDRRALNGKPAHERYRLDAFAIETPPDCPNWRLPNDGDTSRSGLRLPKFLRRYRRARERDPRSELLSAIHNRNIWLLGFFQSQQCFEHHSAQIRQEFQFAKPPEDGAKNWLTRIEKAPIPVALHIRRNDYLPERNPVASLAFCGLGYYERAVAHVAAELSRDITVFAFSDDPEWVRDNLRLDHEIQVVSDNSAIDDMRLMSSCDHAVIANSSFSWWGAWLIGNPGKIITAPDRWQYHHWDTVRQSVPENWARFPICDPYRAGPYRPS
ncbi:MAG: hypothetical protein GKR99_06950 [Rhodobacteraceae bacterium]|nr:hypothetical protein [Paracoccaceae bacterium]